MHFPTGSSATPAALGHLLRVPHLSTAQQLKGWHLAEQGAGAIADWHTIWLAGAPATEVAKYFEYHLWVDGQLRQQGGLVKCGLSAVCWMDGLQEPQTGVIQNLHLPRNCSMEVIAQSLPRRWGESSRNSGLPTLRKGSKPWCWGSLEIP